jgi:Domain of unknown function (DUF4424)
MPKLALLIIVLAASPIWANDSAASVANGGIVQTREVRIAMQKERLTISQTKVTVEYEFLNDTDQDVSTEVAFPIPRYYPCDMVSAGGPTPFDDFKLWVEDKLVAYKTEAKALLNGKDVSALASKFRLDIPSGGHCKDVDDPKSHTSSAHVPDLEKLSASDKHKAIEYGLVSEPDDSYPGQVALWEVDKQYHWRQTFPAHSTVHIRHEYEPAVGFSGVSRKTLEPLLFTHPLKTDIGQQQKDPLDRYPSGKDVENEIRGTCVDRNLYEALGKHMKSDRQDGDWMGFTWVDYILTTANTWKTPIHDFQMIVERPPADSNGGYLLSFCWDGPVQKIDANRFSVQQKDFVPTKEMHVGFFRY